jgi:hypothetical protein
MPRPPCDHNNFTAQVNVSRLSHEAGGTITGYAADVTVSCKQCGMPFRFIGLSGGRSPTDPRVSVDGIELRAPIEPAEREVFVPSLSYTMPPQRVN